MDYNKHSLKIVGEFDANLNGMRTYEILRVTKF